MSQKTSEFPPLVKEGSVVVKIYKVRNKARDRFTVSYCLDGQRNQRTKVRPWDR
jgi:hypothetical protein